MNRLHSSLHSSGKIFSGEWSLGQPDLVGEKGKEGEEGEKEGRMGRERKNREGAKSGRKSTLKGWRRAGKMQGRGKLRLGGTSKDESSRSNGGEEWERKAN